MLDADDDQRLVGHAGDIGAGRIPRNHDLGPDCTHGAPPAHSRARAWVAHVDRSGRIPRHQDTGNDGAVAQLLKMRIAAGGIEAGRRVDQTGVRQPGGGRRVGRAGVRIIVGRLDVALQRQCDP